MVQTSQSLPVGLGKTSSTKAPSKSSSSFISKQIRRIVTCFSGDDMDEPTANPRSVLFVCLGNICRSPIAEAVFRQVLSERGLLDKWTVDSAATADYHVGEPSDNRAEACLRRHGISSNHIVRQLTLEDFDNFAYVIGMDHENVKNIKKIAPKKSPCRVELLGQYDPKNELLIEDPYYGGEAEFDNVYDQCLRCCRVFLDSAEKELNTKKKH
ncbi:hypothetical protein RvY_11815 [Ramazzottius varieornatus]|uniref:Phosphotyrosine protein phosphatase I domain-containing protein n=1 Tax=Ramazzottius varieornatus TaxID=947166 RepID=A0A1D1VQ23_RAMVA|nr:hypothetical protein RvY_11815 [Ramazzottius varieornatus]